ncbi:hypothetical protein ZWY2020_042086 [Hordeum vulgare]|nr:hypothetical protein ZWY2020_042086 [Hordeum vulgare]
MHEELAMNKVRVVAELYTMADRCARAEEGRRLPGNNVGVEADSKDEDANVPTKRGKRRNKKQNGKTVFAVEATGDADSAKKAKAETSGKDAAGCGSCQALAATGKPDGSGAQYGKIHRTKGHDVQHCQQVEQLAKKKRAEYQRCDKEKAQQGGEGSGGKNGAQGRCPGKFKGKKARLAQPREKAEEEEDDDCPDDDSSDHKFHNATDMMCLEGGASLHSSHRQLRKWAREVTAAEPSISARKPILEEDLKDTGAFQGINPGKIQSKGKITLPVTFGSDQNYRTEKVICDVADNPFAYNGILGCRALDKFMAASHYTYGTLKMHDRVGIIVVRADKKDALRFTNCLYREAVAAPVARAPYAASKNPREKKAGQTTSRVDPGKRASLE